jgi:hypothetical protein
LLAYLRLQQRLRAIKTVCSLHELLVLLARRESD